MIDNTDILWQNIFSWPLWITVAIVFACVVAGLLFKTKRFLIWRLITMAFILLVLANPVWRYESGTPSRTSIYAVLDKSDSQILSDRANYAEEAFQDITEKLGQLENVDVKTLIVDRDTAESGTTVFSTLQEALLTEDQSRLGGGVIITDGQVHDIPEVPESWARFGPLHVVMTGDPDLEWDRRVEILSSSGYAVVGEDVPLRLRVDEDPTPRGRALDVVVKSGDDVLARMQAMPGQDYTLRVPVKNPGQNLIEVIVEGDQAELSQINNKAVTKVEGVRDRLKVLLVSGQPYQGLRIWRNLLKSDPAVDLVHFTILRSRHNIDVARQKDLALIPFPTRELFEEKINDFDLIIFDRYTRRSILPPAYFDNIKRYVEKGGALMVVHGVEELGNQPLSETFMGAAFPAKVRQGEGGLVSQKAGALISDFGYRHPILQPLTLLENKWGKWDRYLSAQVQSSTAKILLETKGGDPLLLIDEYGEGRVVQFLTDQVWYWARGHDGGGPYTDLIRRLSHWLMREPSLNYKGFSVQEVNDGFQVYYDGKVQGDAVLTVTGPDGASEKITVDYNKKGFEYLYAPNYPGLYEFQFHEHRAQAFFQNGDAIEYNKLISDTQSLKPVRDATGGGLVLYDAFEDINVALTEKRKKYISGQTLSFKQSSSLDRRTVEFRSVLPYIFAALIGMFLMIMSWVRQE